MSLVMNCLRWASIRDHQKGRAHQEEKAGQEEVAMFGQLFRKLNDNFAPNVVRLIGNLWFPFLGAGIRITEVNDDFRYVRVEMPLHALNKNYVGTHFGDRFTP